MPEEPQYLPYLEAPMFEELAPLWRKAIPTDLRSLIEKEWQFHFPTPKGPLGPFTFHRKYLGLQIAYPPEFFKWLGFEVAQIPVLAKPELLKLTINDLQTLISKIDEMLQPKQFREIVAKLHETVLPYLLKNFIARELPEFLRFQKRLLEIIRWQYERLVKQGEAVYITNFIRRDDLIRSTIFHSTLNWSYNKLGYMFLKYLQRKPWFNFETIMSKFKEEIYNQVDEYAILKILRKLPLPTRLVIQLGEEVFPLSPPEDLDRLEFRIANRIAKK